MACADTVGNRVNGPVAARDLYGREPVVLGRTPPDNVRGRGEPDMRRIARAGHLQRLFVIERPAAGIQSGAYLSLGRSIVSGAGGRQLAVPDENAF